MFIEDGIFNYLILLVDLGKYCNFGVSEFIFFCFKLLEKVLIFSKFILVWNFDIYCLGYWNKVIVQFEKDGEGEVIGILFVVSINVVIDLVFEIELEEYLIKFFIFDFLYEIFRVLFDQFMIVYLFFGFNCELWGLSVVFNGVFDNQRFFFYSLLGVVIELVVNEGD